MDDGRPGSSDRLSLIVVGGLLVGIVLLCGGMIALSARFLGVGMAPTPEPATLLDQVLARGTVIIGVTPNYLLEPGEGGNRAFFTKCRSDQYTAGQLAGFDIDVAVEITKRLGVEPCFVTAGWTMLTNGNWGDRWDISMVAMTITTQRMEVLYFTQPYLTSSAAFFIHKDNTTFSRPSDLSGKRVGVCRGCTYEFYLDGSLRLPGAAVEFMVEDATIINNYATGYDPLLDLSRGDGLILDAVLTEQASAQYQILEGQPIKQLGDPVFFEYESAAVDKNSSKDPISFVKKVNEIIQEMHRDGTMRSLWQPYYSEDLTVPAAHFDIDALGQFPQFP